MTFLTNTDHAAHSGFAARIAAFFHARALRWVQYGVYVRTLSELSSLTDRELTDLGLSRGMLPSVAREAADQTT